MKMGGRERIQRVLTFITLLAGVLADGNHGAVHPLEEYDDLKPHNDTYHAMQLAGNSFQLLCSAKDPIDYCWFQSPNKTMYVPLENSTDPEYEYYGNGLNSGECGITFHHADVKQTGIWSCNMGTTGPDDIRKLIPVKIYDSGLVTFHRVEGKRVMIGCRTFDNSSMEYCRFVRPDGRGIKAMDGVDKYYGNGTDLVLGSCQITMDRTSDEDLGTWTCAAKSILASHEYTNTIIFTKYSSNNSSFGFNLLCWLFYIIVILGLSCLMVSLIYKTKAVSRLQNRAKVIRASFKSKKQFETIA